MGTWTTPPLSGSDFIQDSGSANGFDPLPSVPVDFVTVPGAPVDFEISPGKLSDFASGCTGPPSVDYMFGPTGPTGPTGPVGPGGIGNRWWDGPGPPTMQPGMQIGDYYLDTISGNVYELLPGFFALENPSRALVEAPLPYVMFTSPVDSFQARASAEPETINFV